MLSKVANVRGDENEPDCLNEAEDVGVCSAIFSASMSNRERDMTIKRFASQRVLSGHMHRIWKVTMVSTWISVLLATAKFIQPNWMLSSISSSLSLTCHLLIFYQPHSVTKYNNKNILEKDVSRIFSRQSPMNTTIRLQFSAPTHSTLCSSGCSVTQV